VNESFFQTKGNSDALKDVEALIFDEDVKIIDKPIISDLELEIGFEKFKATMPYDVEKTYQTEKLKEILVEKGFLHPKKYKKVPQASPDIYQKKYEICNNVSNPKVEQGRYKICSDADLKGKQAFFFKVRQRPIQPFIDEYRVSSINKFEDLPQNLDTFPLLLKAKELGIKELEKYKRIADSEVYNTFDFREVVKILIFRKFNPYTCKSGILAK